MQGYARAFRITIWVGIAINFALALPGLLAPDWLLRVLGFDVAFPNLWPRFAAWLLILLSLFYIPAALDPYRYRVIAVLAVGARWAGVLFFSSMVLAAGFSSRYLLFGLVDLVIAVPGTVLLVLALRGGAAAPAATPFRTDGAVHGAAVPKIAQTP